MTFTSVDDMFIVPLEVNFNHRTKKTLRCILHIFIPIPCETPLFYFRRISPDTILLLIHQHPKILTKTIYIPPPTYSPLSHINYLQSPHLKTPTTHQNKPQIDKLYSLSRPLIRRANCMSLGMIVTLFP